MPYLDSFDPEEVLDKYGKLTNEEMINTVIENVPPPDVQPFMNTEVMFKLLVTMSAITYNESRTLTEAKTAGELAGFALKAIWWQGYKAACERKFYQVAPEENTP